jgi:enoyl-CoA hydratase/carnithine racemase
MRRERSAGVETLWLAPSLEGRGYVLADWAYLLETCRELATDAVGAADAPDAAVRCLVLRGECAGLSVGADLRDVREHVTGGHGEEYKATTRLALRTLAGLALPTVALIDGPCTAGSTAIVNACDVRLGSPAATFEFPPARLGLVYPQVSVQLLVRAVGSPAAKHLLYSGRVIDAAHALRIGLLQEVGDPAGLLARFIAEIAGGEPASHRAHKLLVDHAASTFDSAELEQAGYDTQRFADAAQTCPQPGARP